MICPCRLSKHSNWHIRLHFEDLNDWLKEFIKNNSNKNSLRNNNQCTINEDTHEPPSSEIGVVEEVLHEEDINSLISDSEKYE